MQALLQTTSRHLGHWLMDEGGVRRRHTTQHGGDLEKLGEWIHVYCLQYGCMIQSPGTRARHSRPCIEHQLPLGNVPGGHQPPPRPRDLNNPVHRVIHNDCISVTAAPALLPGDVCTFLLLASHSPADRQLSWPAASCSVDWWTVFTSWSSCSPADPGTWEPGARML